MLNKKQRHEVRRKLRRAHENIPLVRYRSIVAAKDWDIWLPRFFTLHRLSHPEKDSFMTSQMETFFTDMSRRFAAHGQMRIGFLLLEDEPMASMMQFDYAGKLHLYNSGYNPDYAHLSPGVVLLAHCIQDAIRDQRYEYDFLRGTERYKYDLGGRDRGVFRVDYRP